MNELPYLNIMRGMLSKYNSRPLKNYAKAGWITVWIDQPL